MGSESVGERIRLLRLQRGKSIRQVAALAGISHAHWSRIERSERSADNRFMLSAIASALGVAVAELTDSNNMGPAGVRPEFGAGVQRIMRAVVQADLDDPPRIEPGPIVPLLDRLDLVLSLRLKCDYIGAGRIIPDVLSGLHAAAFGRDRAQALRGLVLADDTASFVVRYLGDPTAAVLVADRSQQAAVALQDPVMLAMASWAQAHAANGCSLYPRALRIAERAILELEQHTGLPDAREMLGQLYVLNGFTRYAQGDIIGAQAAVDEAARLAQLTGQTSALGLYFGPTNVAFWQVGMHADGGDPGHAMQIANTIDPAGFAAVGRSRKIAFFIDTARALASIGKDRGALRMILAAEREAPQRIRLSPVVSDVARSLLERANRGTGWSELRGLCERVGIQH